MTVASSAQILVNNLISLKTQYEQALTEADTIASHYREQLSHVNALLLNQLGSVGGLVPLQAHIKSAEPVLDAIAALQESTQIKHLTLPPATTEVASVASPTPEVSPKPPKATKSESTPTAGGRTPRELLPVHQGLKRLDAIAKVFQNHQGQEVTIDALTQELFGNLSAAAHKAERLKLRTLLYQGEQRGLWQKGNATSTYLIKGTGKTEAQAVTPVKSKAAGKSKVADKPIDKASAKAPKVTSKTGATKQRISLPLLPSFQGLTKLEAIESVLNKYRGEVLHHDTIIQNLYGELSPEEIKAERVRIKTALLGGVKNKKWQKASVASSYFLPETSASTKSKAPGRKSKAPKDSAPQPEPSAEVLETSAATSGADSSKNNGGKATATKAPAKSKFKRTRKTATQSKAEGA
jgi:hypothetical protein